MVSTIGAVLVVVVTSFLFVVYDFLVRRELSAKEHLLEVKRKFMRFVSVSTEITVLSWMASIDLVQVVILFILPSWFVVFLARSTHPIECRLHGIGVIARRPNRSSNRFD